MIAKQLSSSLFQDCPTKGMEAPELLRQHRWFGDSCSHTADRHRPVGPFYSVQHSKEGHDRQGVPQTCQQWQVRNKRQIACSTILWPHVRSVHTVEMLDDELLMCSVGYAVHVMTTLRNWKGSTGRTWLSTLQYTGRMLTGLCMTLWVLNPLGVVAHQKWSQFCSLFFFFRFQSGHGVIVFFSVCYVTAVGSQRVEHLPFRHHTGHCGTGKWHHHRRCQHTLPVFWYVEDHICLAHRGHGPVQH